jgi:hypothetical protein
MRRSSTSGSKAPRDSGRSPATSGREERQAPSSAAARSRSATARRKRAPSAVSGRNCPGSSPPPEMKPVAAKPGCAIRNARPRVTPVPVACRMRSRSGWRVLAAGLLAGRGEMARALRNRGREYSPNRLARKRRGPRACCTDCTDCRGRPSSPARRSDRTIRATSNRSTGSRLCSPSRSAKPSVVLASS